MASYSASLLVLVALFSASWPAWVSGYDTNIDNAKQMAGEAMHDAKEASESWAEWVQDKVTGGLGLGHNNARMAAEQMMDSAGNVVSETGEKISSVASGAADIASKKAGAAKETMMNKAGEAKDVMSDKAGNAKASMANGAGQASDSAQSAYEGAKQRMNEAARDTKEKASQVTGNMGASMNKKMAEL